MLAKGMEKFILEKLEVTEKQLQKPPASKPCPVLQPTKSNKQHIILAHG